MTAPALCCLLDARAISPPPLKTAPVPCPLGILSPQRWPCISLQPGPPGAPPWDHSPPPSLSSPNGRFSHFLALHHGGVTSQGIQPRPGCPDFRCCKGGGRPPHNPTVRPQFTFLMCFYKSSEVHASRAPAYPPASSLTSQPAALLELELPARAHVPPQAYAPGSLCVSEQRPRLGGHRSLIHHTAREGRRGAPSGLE